MTAELLDLAVLKQVVDDRVLAQQLLERRGVGRKAGLRLLLGCQPEPVEQDLAQLRGGVDVELLACVLPDLAAQAIAVVAELIVEPLQLGHVDPDADDLHARQHPHERDLDVVVQRCEPAPLQGGRQRIHQSCHRQGAPAGLLPRRHRGVVEVELTLGRTGAVGQAGLGVAVEQFFEHVARLGRIDQVRRDHRVEHQRVHVDPVIEQSPHQGLGVVRRELAAIDRHQRAQGIGDRGLGDDLSGDPRHVAHRHVGDEREPFDRRAPFGTSERRRHRQRVRAGAQRLEQRGGRGRGVDDGHLGLDDGRVRRGRAIAAGFLTQRFDEPVVQRAELEEVEQFAHDGHVEVVGAQWCRTTVELHVAQQHHHLGVLTNLSFGLGQVLAQLRRLLVDVLEDAVDSAVLVDQLGGRLLAHSRHTRQVVGRITTQGRVLHVQLGAYTGALLDPGFVVQRVVRHAPPVVEHAHVGILDELVGVAVARDDQHLVAVVAGPRGERGDDVVGFEARCLDDRQPQRLDDLAHQTHLLPKDVGCRLAVGLVGRDPFVPEGRLGPVEGHGDVVGLVIADEVDQHRGEPEHRVRHLARGRGHVRGQREERPIGERVPIDEHDFRHRR